jgi:uncharacterized protein (DUF1810 family)
MFRPDLFIGAQAAPAFSLSGSFSSNYSLAFHELVTQRKTYHWMWYVFPQLRGLGQSDPSVLFGLDKEDAPEYLAHPILGSRLLEMTALAHSLDDVRATFGHVDTMKLRSSMTLFWLTTGGRSFGSMLERHFDQELCPLTRQVIAR